MRGLWIGSLLAIATIAASGCQSTPSAPKTRIVSNEPALDVGAGAGSGTLVAEQPPKRAERFVDRHPLFYKPREYYDSSGGSKLAKGAAATVIGVPAGVFAEVKQMVRGQPESPSPTY